MSFEPLEGRRLLAAADLGGIAGTVYLDRNGDGPTAGDEIHGATVELYRDGDGSGTLTAADGSPIADQQTDAAGRFRFDHLAVGDYFVRQPAQTVNETALKELVNPLISIDSDVALGRLGQVIDSFLTAQQVIAPFPLNTSQSSAIPAPEALGGERDLIGQLSAGGVDDSIMLQTGQDGISQLRLTPTLDATGTYQVVWDGPDGQGGELDPKGLQTAGAGVDLTQGGVISHLRFTAGVDKVDGVARLRIYSDGENWSEATIPLADVADQTYLVDLRNDLVTGAGAGADVTDVGAVELTVEANRAGMNGLVATVETRGPTWLAADFVNQPSADLSVSLRVNDPTPTANERLFLTLQVDNSGPHAATGVEIVQLLPAGLNFVSALPSQGEYSSTDGIWTLGDLPASGNATLEIEASVQSASSISVEAEVSAVDQPDPDSTPGNSASDEDDRSSLQIQPLAADLSLSHSVDDPSPDVGQGVIFTITVRNDGPEPATGVSVLETLPDGIAYLSPYGVGEPINAAPIGWSINYLPPGGESSMQIRGLVTKGGEKTVRAEIIRSDQLDPDSTPGNHLVIEDDQSDLTIAPLAADLALSLAVDESEPDVGSEVTYTVSVANEGPDDASGIAVSISLPTGLGLVGVQPSDAAFDDQSGLWSIDQIPAGASAALDLVAHVTGIGTSVVTAEVAASDRYDPDSTPANADPSEDDLATVTIDAFRAPPPGLTVESFTPTPSGYVAEFNKNIDTSVLNLYGTQNGNFGPADATLTGELAGDIPGTLFAQGNRLEFVATGGALPADRYTVSLRSAEDGIRAADDPSLLLNGEFTGLYPSGDETVGGDFLTTFETVDAVAIGLADFAAGPGQSIGSLPDSLDAALGIPIIISDAAGVESVDVAFSYDPLLLNVTEVQLGPEMPEGSLIQANLDELGLIRIAFLTLDPLPAGSAVLGMIRADVPSTAAYGSAHVLRVVEAQINEGLPAVIGDASVHLVAFVGDTTGNGEYSSLDAQRLARVTVGKDSGFAAYPNVDPKIVADITGDGQVTGLDGSAILQEVLGMDSPLIPPLPAAADA